MQLVIDIDDNLYTRLFDNGDEYVADMRRACVAIRKGTPLPKGHGKIIDVKEADLINHFYAYISFNDACELVDSLPSILEAEMIESEEEQCG